MSLTTLNNTIKISSAVLTGVNSKDSLVFMSRLNRDDFNIIGNYINNVVVQALKSLTSKPEYPVDALESGISGMTIVTYPENLGNSFSNSEMFWKKGVAGDTGRPCTVKESFDYVLSNLTQQIIQVVERTEDITGLIDELRCNALNNLSIKNETLGVNYPLLCNGETIGSYPLAKHLYEIFNQVVVGHDIAELEYLDNGDLTYPELSFTTPEISTPEATEEISGTLEVATTRDIALMVGPSDSSSGNSYLAVTTENLLNALEIDAVEVGETNLLRESIKDVAFEKLQESSIFDLADVHNLNTLVNKHTLIYDSASQKFINRLIVWEDIQMRPSVTEAQLYSSTQNSNIINTKQDYTFEEKDTLLKSHNTLSYKKSSNKWEIAKYKDYKSLSPAISYGLDILKTNISISGHVIKKVPFTLAFAYKNARYPLSSNASLYAEYSSEVEETVSLFDELKDPKSRVMSSHSLWWEEGIEAFYNMGTSAVGIYRTDKTYERIQGNYFLNANNTENSYFSIYKNLVTETDIMTEGESLVMILGTYNVSDKLYACPSYINRRYGLVNKEVTFCISDRYFNQGLTSYLTAEGFNINQRETISSEVLNEKNFIGVVTKKYNYDSEVGGRVDLGGILGIVDYGLNISNSHKLCADLLDIDGNFSTGNTFYEFIEDLWASKYPGTKDLFDQTQREAIAPLVEFSLAYCKLKL
jgi:hypothetical protein